MSVARVGVEDHERFMRRALVLARNGLGLVSPNPLVGAVVVSGGEIVGEGWHEGPGTPHAEINALSAAGDRARGATLYVTLEPCTHVGRTPPCAPVVRDAGIVHVVAAIRDPNPLIDGSGLRLLEESGVEVTTGILAEDAEELIDGFARQVRTGLPFVTLKIASTLDGKTAARDGSSRWITGEEARQDVHRLRAASDAILVGTGTALTDDPSLTVRLEGYRGRQPLRVVLDGWGRLAEGAALLDGAAPTLIATTPAAPATAREVWTRAGAEIMVFEDAGPDGRIPLTPLVEALGKREVQAVLVEGGPTVAWWALDAGLIDRIVLYLAPKLIGGRDALGVLGGPGAPTISDAMPLRIRRIEPLGEDIKVVADVHRDR